MGSRSAWLYGPLLEVLPRFQVAHQDVLALTVGVYAGQSLLLCALAAGLVLRWRKR